MTRMRDFRRGRPAARWSEPELAEVVLGVLAGAPEVLWSADDVRERLAFGHEGAGPAATSVRAALRALEDAGRVERVEVWGRRGWGNTAHAFRPARAAGADAGDRPGLTVAA
ncbi:MAG: hypothetical protein AB7O78_10185 [Thermoleophilia bacterium]